MAKANKEYNTFVAGIITEASPLTYPQNASRDEANFVLLKNGSRVRRKGLERHSLVNVFPGINFSNYAFQAKYFNFTVNGVLKTYLAHQFGSKVYIKDMTSGSTLVHTMYLNRRNPDGSINPTPTESDPTYNVSFSSGKNKIFVCKRDIDPFYIDIQTLSVYDIQLKVRDFEGLEDGTSPNNQEDTEGYSDEHQYNLLNQGWTSTWINKFVEQTNGRYPSNIHQWFLAKDSQGNFDCNNLFKNARGSTPAPKGHYIVNPFYKDYSLITHGAITGIPTSIVTERPSSVAFYAGRAFYAGVRGSKLATAIFFSKIIEKDGDESKCYQEADPTSETISDLVATDGGVIYIHEIGHVKKLEPILGSLLVFADNGVWEISGGSGGFKATDYSVKKITNAGAIGSDSIVNAGSSVLYFSHEGINVISSQSNNINQNFSATNISQTTIQSLYNDIPAESRQQAVGYYDSYKNSVKWLYKQNITTTSIYGFTKWFDSELILDLSLNAFSKNTFPYKSLSTVAVVGALVPPILGSTSVDEVVKDSSDVVVTDSKGLAVYVEKQFISGQSPTTHYLTLNFNNNLYISRLTSTDFKDEGIPFESYLITGEDIAGDTMRDKQINYLVCHFKRTETSFINKEGALEFNNPSSCLCRVRWDFSDSSTSGLWSSQFQAYRIGRHYIAPAVGVFDYGQEVITTKNKVRGSGKAISFEFRSEEGKDMHILGWAISMEGRPAV